MTPEEANALLTSVAVSDKLIENDEFSAAAWYTSLAGVPYDQAVRIAVEYYANRDPGAGSITPGYIRRQASTENDRNASKRAALERGQRDAPTFHAQLADKFRSAEFQWVMNQSALDHFEDLERRGIQLTPVQEKRRQQICNGEPATSGGIFPQPR